MAGHLEVPPATSEPTGKRLDSWRKSRPTQPARVDCRRWEQQEGLPVHRHLRTKLGSIYAYARELDTWLDSRRKAESPRPVLLTHFRCARTPFRLPHPS